jgi:hypothetical protein
VGGVSGTMAVGGLATTRGRPAGPADVLDNLASSRGGWP